jgi:hypothetical protein
MGLHLSPPMGVVPGQFEMEFAELGLSTLGPQFTDKQLPYLPAIQKGAPQKTNQP